MVAGVGITAAGFGGEAGGLALSATGVGALGGVPLAAASAGVVAYGGAVMGRSASNFGQDARDMFMEASSNGGVGKAASGPKHIQRNVKDVDAYDDIQKHLGDGETTNIHPKKGTVEPDSIYSKQSDGTTNSVRMGDHETRNPNNQHYHLENWDSNGNFVGPDQSVKINNTSKRR